MEFDLLTTLIIIAISVIAYIYYGMYNTVQQTNYLPVIHKKVHKKIKKHNSKKYNSKKYNSKKLKPKEDLVCLDIATSNKIIGSITIKLFSDIVPKTCKNFRTLCDKKSKHNYIDSKFHRIINNFMIQGGDIDGLGGFSIYGKSFEDENFKLKHSEPYLLSMANHGPNTNGSQFFITTGVAKHLDKKHVVFGKVVDGFEIVDKLNNVSVDESDEPLDNIVIANCKIL
jgi:cyclophilin family peptidyl-prolyl cis-trans isomerase